MDKLLMILGITVITIALFKRYNLPSIVAYLLIGCVMGPFSLEILHIDTQIQLLAEIGVVFLLFTIGLELPLAKFLEMRRNFVLIGGAQVLLCTLIMGLMMYLCGTSFLISWMIASALAMSSTAIVMRQLSEQNELFAKHGQLAFSMLIFQDIAAVPLLILLPFLSKINQFDLKDNMELLWTVIRVLGEGMVIFILIIFLSKTIIKSIFHRIVLTRSLELFMFMVLFVALLSAVTTNAIGLSMSFGAFVAGIGLGESEYRHQIDAEVRPFRDILLGVFFISIGMMLDTKIVFENIPLILICVIGIVFIKCFVISALCYFLGQKVNLTTALKSGLIMAHAGEFGLAILTLSSSYGIVRGFPAQIALAAMIISLFVAVLLTKYNNNIIRFLLANKFVKKLHKQDHAQSDVEQEILEYQNKRNICEMQDHIIICGFGRVGKTLIKFIHEKSIPYICLDLNATLVKNGVMAGYNVYYGDASIRSVLDSICLNNSKLVAICVDDDVVAKKVTSCIRSLHGTVPILVRTRDFKHRKALLSLGANEIVAETFEASAMLALHLFLLLGVKAEDAMNYINKTSKELFML